MGRISLNIKLFTFENIGSNTNKNTNTLTQQRRISLNIKLFTLENIGSNTNKKQTQIHSLSRDRSHSISNCSLWRILAQIQIKNKHKYTHSAETDLTQYQIVHFREYWLKYK